MSFNTFIIITVRMRSLTSIITHPRTQVSSDLNPWQATELVFINSSPGPNQYMRPRSPPSPTISRLAPWVPQLSGSFAARLNNDYLMSDGQIFPIANWNILKKILFFSLCQWSWSRAYPSTVVFVRDKMYSSYVNLWITEKFYLTL